MEMENGSHCKLMLPENEVERIKIVKECQILKSSTNETDFDRYTSLARRIFNMPFSAVSIVDTDCTWTKSAMGIPTQSCPRNVSICSHVIMPDAPDVLVLENTAEDERFCDNPICGKDGTLRFYAGGALIVDGHKVGTLCVLDVVPREFSMTDKLNLLELTAAVSTLLRNRREVYLNQKMLKETLHHIRTPLTSLNCELALLQEESSSLQPNVATMLNNIAASVTALNLSVGSANGGFASKCGSSKSSLGPAENDTDSPTSSLKIEIEAPQKVRVLLVEDSALIQKVMRKWLENQGCDVHSALNGLLGLNKLKEEQFDIVVTDFLMPVMDGLECLRQLYTWRAEGSNALLNEELVVIGMSATANSAEQLEAYAYGMQAFSVKPVDLNLLKLAIDMKGRQVPLSQIIAAMVAHTGVDPALVAAPVERTPNLMTRKMTPMSMSFLSAALSPLSHKAPPPRSPLSTSFKKSPKLKPVPKPEAVSTCDNSQIEGQGGHKDSPPGTSRSSFLSPLTNLLKRGGSGSRITPI